jgi:hypothetical protein
MGAQSGPTLPNKIQFNGCRRIRTYLAGGEWIERSAVSVRERLTMR